MTRGIAAVGLCLVTAATAFATEPSERDWRYARNLSRVSGLEIVGVEKEVDEDYYETGTVVTLTVKLDGLEVQRIRGPSAKEAFDSVSGLLCIATGNDDEESARTATLVEARGRDVLLLQGEVDKLKDGSRIRRAAWGSRADEEHQVLGVVVGADLFKSVRAPRGALYEEMKRAVREARARGSADVEWRSESHFVRTDSSGLTERVEVTDRGGASVRTERTPSLLPRAAAQLGVSLPADPAAEPEQQKKQEGAAGAYKGASKALGGLLGD